MNPSLFKNLIEQCAEGKPDIIELYFHADPLTDERLEERAAYTKEKCPDSLVAIVVNEASLGLERAARLAGSGLDVVFVSINEPGGGSRESISGRLERTALARDVLEKGGTRLSVTTLGNFLSDESILFFSKTCRELNLPLEIFRATTRLGDIDISPHLAKGSPVQRRLCERPFMKSYIKYNGDMVICCEDWRYRFIAGNAGADGIAPTWNGVFYKELRGALLGGKLPSPCSGCDYPWIIE